MTSGKAADCPSHIPLCLLAMTLKIFSFDPPTFVKTRILVSIFQHSRGLLVYSNNILQKSLKTILGLHAKISTYPPLTDVRSIEVCDDDLATLQCGKNVSVILPAWFTKTSFWFDCIKSLLIKLPLLYCKRFLCMEAGSRHGRHYLFFHCYLEIAK